MTHLVIRGNCPMGCGRTLERGTAGHVRCGAPGCPRPNAAGELLSDAETEHIVLFGEDDFTVRHPLRERLDDALMDCELHHYIAAMDVPPVTPGRYRAQLDALGEWVWEPLL